MRGYGGRVISHAVCFANLGLRSAIRLACEMPVPRQMNMAIKNGMGGIEFVASIGSILSRYSSYINASNKLAQEIALITVQAEAKYIVSDVLQRGDLVETIRAFLSGVPNSDLPPTCFWDTAVIYNILYDRIRCPSLYKAIGAFHADLAALMQNVDQFYQMIKDLVRWLRNPPLPPCGILRSASLLFAGPDVPQAVQAGRRGERPVRAAGHGPA